MQTDKVSAIVPCLWADEKLLAMTASCLHGLRELYETIVINCDRSYAGNVNAGLKIASGDYLMVCNNDIEFIQPDWLTHLIKPLKDGYDISSIRTSDSDGYLTEDKITEGDKFGSIWMMRRKVYETIGGLDENFGKGYFEDLDFQKRAEDAGFRVAKNHAGIVEHIGKATFSLVDVQDSAYTAARDKFKEKYGKVW